MFAMILYIFIILTTNCFFNSAEIIVREDSSILAEYVTFVYEKFCRPAHGFVGIVVNDNDNHAVEKSLSSIHNLKSNSFALINFNYFERDRTIFEQLKLKKMFFGYLKLLIVFIKTINELHPVINNLIFLPLYRPRNQMLVIFDQTLDTEEVIYVFQYCWSKRFINFVLIFLKDRKIQVFTYNPFLEGNKMLQNFTDVLYDQNLFYDKLINLHGFKITCLIIRDEDITKIVTIKLPSGNIIYTGLDVDIVTNLIGAMNGTAVFVNSQLLLPEGVRRNPWRNTNDPMKDAVKIKKQIIVDNNIDMVNADEMVLNDDFSGVTESLYPHDKDDLVFMIKRGEKIPYYRYLFMIFQFELWVAFILIILFVVVFWIGLKYCVNLLFKKNIWQTKIITILRGVIATAVPIKQIPSLASERLLFIFWLLYCFILILSFQSKLTDILMEPKYYSDVTTLQQMDESVTKIRVYGNLIPDLYKSLTSTSKVGLASKLVPMPVEYDNINPYKFVYSMHLFDYPTMYSYSRASAGIRLRPFCSKTRQLINLIPESPLPRYMALQVTAGSPYLKRLDKTMTRLKECGFLKYWYGKWEYYSVLKKMIIPSGYKFNAENNDFNNMTLDHLSAAFFIYFSGVLLSGVIFFAERINFKYKLCLFST